MVGWASVLPTTAFGVASLATCCLYTPALGVYRGQPAVDAASACLGWVSGSWCAESGDEPFVALQVSVGIERRVVHRSNHGNDGRKGTGVSHAIEQGTSSLSSTVSAVSVPAHQDNSSGVQERSPQGVLRTFQPIHASAQTYLWDLGTFFWHQLHGDDLMLSVGNASLHYSAWGAHEGQSQVNDKLRGSTSEGGGAGGIMAVGVIAVFVSVLLVGVCAELVARSSDAKSRDQLRNQRPFATTRGRPSVGPPRDLRTMTGPGATGAGDAYREHSLMGASRPSFLPGPGPAGRPSTTRTAVPLSVGGVGQLASVVDPRASMPTPFTSTPGANERSVPSGKICESLVLQHCRSHFIVPVQRLVVQRASGGSLDFDILGLSGNPLLRATVEAPRSAGTGYVDIVFNTPDAPLLASCRPAPHAQGHPAEELQILNGSREAWGMMASQGRGTGRWRVWQQGRALWELQWNAAAKSFIVHAAEGGAGTRLVSADDHDMRGESLQVEVEQGVDAVLGLITMLASIAFSPDKS